MRKYLLAIIGLVLLCLLAAVGSAGGSPDTYIVNTTDDSNDGSCDALPTGDCTLREAIIGANSDGGDSTIAFNIPDTDAGHEVSGISGTWTISLTSSLPTLTDDGTIISGTTQADLNPDGPEIEISAASPSVVHCLVIESASNVVHGMVINRCPFIGVLIQTTGADYNTVSGNYIGIDASGSTDLGNGKFGVAIGDGSQGNVVGGNTPEERNVISGNNQYGVYIYGDDTDQNTVSGNYIGTDATGTLDRGNAETGVAIAYGAQNNIVGGDTEAERNIISGNKGRGVNIEGNGTVSNTVSGNFIGIAVTGTGKLGNTSFGVGIGGGAQNNMIGGDSEWERNVISGNSIGVSIGGTGTTSNTVSGNYIGTDVSGSLSGLGNTSYGIRIAGTAKNNVIGGDSEGERNIISGNDQYGVNIYGSGVDGNTVSGNYIGTDATGTQELGNGLDGVIVSDGAQNNTIGGQTAAERNVISGNKWSGVHIRGTDTMSNTVSSNYIGTDYTGTQDKGNGDDGVTIGSGAKNNTIGPENLIAHNHSHGVLVRDSSTTGNTLTQNSIHSNAFLGIELSDGGNGLYPAPIDISVDGCFTVSGTAAAGDTVEVFTGSDEEGKRYLAASSADGAGDWSVTGPFILDAYVTATATDAAGNTSKFSTAAPAACYPVFLPLTVKNY